MNFTFLLQLCICNESGFSTPSSYALVSVFFAVDKIANKIKNLKCLHNKHKHVFYQHDKNLWEKIHILVSAENTNLSIVNNKSICSKQHQILLFLHISLNMLFLTKKFLVVTTHSHVHCQNISDLFLILLTIFCKKLLEQEHMSQGSNVHFWFVTHVIIVKILSKCLI
jgi:hypothetical protein